MYLTEMGYDVSRLPVHVDTVEEAVDWFERNPSGVVERAHPRSVKTAVKKPSAGRQPTSGDRSDVKVCSPSPQGVSRSVSFGDGPTSSPKRKRDSSGKKNKKKKGGNGWSRGAVAATQNVRYILKVKILKKHASLVTWGWWIVGLT